MVLRRACYGPPPVDPHVQEFVLAYLQEHAKVPLSGRTEDDLLATAYLDEGVLDSMAVVELVVSLEERFGVQLEPEHMQSEEFRTAGGVVAMATRLRSSA
jgi:D-alanine--poly(phosphoribitol) ligase subunit 2